ncbi:MAG: hypothetical protein ACR2PK_11775 [Acidimicrobiales bacterium]
MTRRRLIASVISWLALSIALWLSDAEPSVIALAGIVAVVAAIGIVVFDLGTTAQTLAWPPPAQSKPAGDVQTESIPRPLKDVHGAVRSHPDGLRPRLVALVDDRLTTHKGIDRQAAPAIADDVLTPALRNLVASSSHRIGSTREVATIIDEIEAL